MKNRVQDGITLEFLNTTGAPIVSGQVVPLIARIAIACVDIAVNAKGSIDMEGVYRVAKTTGTAYAFGDELYWDKPTSKLVKVASGTTVYAGMCAGAEISGATSCAVRLQSGNNL